MIEELKIMLGETAANYSDALIGLTLKQSLAEVQAYCNREIDYELQIVAEKITVIKLNRLHSEGLTAQSYSGISETYTEGYPAEIQQVLNRKRKIKFL